MTSSADLLRMLEPAVRPVSVPGAENARPGSVPLEQRSFESLLSDAAGAKASGTSGASGGAGASGGSAGAAQLSPQPAPQHPLAGIDRIENSALRDLIAARGSKA
jgi:hypothetical protein